jgi:DNA-binding NtrC family response regulator
VDAVCSEYGRPVKKVQPDAIKLLQEMDWTGNIRELRNVIERLIILSETEITASDVQCYVSPTMLRYNALTGVFAQFNNIEEVLKFVADEWSKYKA